jgi:hypothetical protein
MRHSLYSLLQELVAMAVLVLVLLPLPLRLPRK